MNLDAAIRKVQESYSLSADTRNALHGAISSHPWCTGKTLEQRKRESSFAVAGRVSNADLDLIQKAKA